MALGLSLSGYLQPAAIPAQVQKADSGPSLLENHYLITRFVCRAGHDFEGVLGAILHVGGGSQYLRALGIQHEQIVIVARTSQRIGPEQAEVPTLLADGVVGSGTEHVHGASGK